MSDTCGNCDCADKSHCTYSKKGDSYGAGAVVVDTESSRVEIVEEVTVAEHDGCKCGTSCSCGGASCSCGK